MSNKDNLLNKIEDKTAVIGVIGLGYVGLPLATEIAKFGYEVIGFDIQDKKVNMINQGKNYIEDVSSLDIKNLVESERLKATTNFDFVRRVDIVLICVPTPLDKYQQPDISYLKESAKEVAKCLTKGMIVIL